MQTSQFIFSSILTLMTFYANKYREDDFQKTMDELEDNLGIPEISTYDFIIVGAGAAGCVVANRLSDHFNVLLLEAGGNPPPQTKVPAFTNFITSVSSIHFEYTSVPQINASLSTEGTVRRRPGKMMGGSSSHHSFGYNRGNPLDFDNWASIVNDSSWKYENIIKYFQKSERYVGSIGKGTYGLTGPMVIDDEITPALNLWLEAGRELGYDKVDPNGPQREGFAQMPVTLENGRRVSSYTAFIEPIEKIRTNLTVIRYATVMEILIDVSKRAYGVQYIRHGFPQIAHVSKEVIICGGAFASPLLLLKSGIGPFELLNQAKIPVVVDLPVGQGFQDHVTVVLQPIYVNDTVKFPTKISAWSPNTIDQYFNQNGEGVLGAYTRPSQAFLTSSRAKRNLENNWPDIQLVFKPGFHHDKDDVEMAIDVVLSRPKSAGFISLNTSEYLKGVRDDEKLAIVDYNLLADVTDIEVLIEGIKFVMKLVENSTAFQHVGAKYSEIPFPGCGNQEFRSDDYWECFIRHKAAVWFHLSGSCSMGSVVDSKLKVISVTGLRVIDGSVMPKAPNANTVAAVVMISEKGSAMILEEYLL